MRRLFIISGIVFGVIVVAIIAIPLLFKDDIQRALDQAMRENLEAEVFYDIDKFSLSLIRHFPNITVGLGDFGIAGVDEFAGDTLVYVKHFQLTIDVLSILTGGQIKVKEISLAEPKIEVLVMEDGTANYDITTREASPESAEPAEEAGSNNIRMAIDKWAITDGQVIYLDRSIHFYAILLGLNHEGSGDFTLDEFDMHTVTDIASLSLGYEGQEYVSDKRLSADITLDMDLGKMRFTFEENRVAINEFAIGADGYLSMPSDDINMDITFGGSDIGLKSILSLIPGTYQEYLSGVEASGTIGFDGYIKGTLSDTSMPEVAANLSVERGRIVYADYPIPMEDMAIRARFAYPSADLSETSFHLDKFYVSVDGEPISAYLTFKNLEDYEWDFGFDGSADLEKITRIIPIEDIDLKGKINAKLATTGRMSDLEAEQYDRLPTSGNLTIKDFALTSPALPQTFSLSTADVRFNPSEINLVKFIAKAGATDMELDGKVSNYLGFVLGEAETLTGNLNVHSKSVDINEWMVAEPASEEETEGAGGSAPLEVVRVPENIEFVLQSHISKITYTNLVLEDFEGRVLIKDGALILDENTFKMLEGAFTLKGAYVTKDLENPKYDFSLGIKDLSIARAHQSFGVVQQYVPIARQVSGNFSTDVRVDGLLGQDMMPLMDEINMAGMVSITEALLEKGEFVQKVSSVASLKGIGDDQASQNIKIKDVLISTAIKNGRLYVDPFDIEVNGQEAVLGGSNGLDGSLDYIMTMKDVPTGIVGDALNNALRSFTGGKKMVADKVDLNLGIGGTYSAPRVSLLGSSPSSSGGASEVTTSLEDQVMSKVNEQKAEAERKAKEIAEKKKLEVEEKKKKAEEEAKRKLEEEKKKAEEEAKKKLKKLFKKGGG